MSIPTIDELPDALKTIRTRPLFVLQLAIRKPLLVGTTPAAYRRIGVIPGGSFKGDRLAGEVLEGGSDWQTIRADGAITLNVRLVLRTDDDALITKQYPGMRHGSAEVLAKVDRGEPVDPAAYYLRIAPVFETAAARYQWLNRVVAVGTGHRLADGVLYSVFELL